MVRLKRDNIITFNQSLGGVSESIPYGPFGFVSNARAGEGLELFPNFYQPRVSQLLFGSKDGPPSAGAAQSQPQPAAAPDAKLAPSMQGVPSPAQAAAAAAVDDGGSPRGSPGAARVGGWWAAARRRARLSLRG